MDQNGIELPDDVCDQEMVDAFRDVDRSRTAIFFAVGIIFGVSIFNLIQLAVTDGGGILFSFVSPPISFFLSITIGLLLLIERKRTKAIRVKICNPKKSNIDFYWS